ncbi:MAG: hypothetical protein M3Z02_05020, partial [Actinomycetota bacterium]|nr:hypothetical protein [Actinomycetota bacterium]
MQGPSLPGPAAGAGQALVAVVNCRANRRADATATVHEVTVQADWTVFTPHDLAVERVAVALGGYLSCVEFVDNVIPAVRRWVGVNTRRELPRMRRDEAGGWLSLEPVPGCCTRSPYPSAVALAEHQRSRRHCATAYAADPDQMAAFTKQVARAHGFGWGQPLPVVAAKALRRCVERPDDVRELWQAGIGPETILAVHRRLAPRGGRRPVSLYLGVLTEQPDPDWLVASAAAAPADGLAREDLLEWLAWTETSLDRRFRIDRSECLAMGIPRSTIWALSTNGYRPSDVHALERASGLSPVGAARLLEGWVAAGCTPSVV